jgi:RHS repeat-associated protein
MTDASGVIQGQYSYDPYGRATQFASAQSSDLRYAGYYGHSPSGLSLTTYRAYNAVLGRWINRDPIEESGDNNLFAYALNAPTSVIDPTGLQGNVIAAPSSGLKNYIMYSSTGNNFAQMIGAPPGVLNPGCIAVVDFYLGLGPGVVPESVFKKNCWWGSGPDVTPAAAKAKKCSANNPCPSGSHRVIWCKQGTWGTGGINPNPPGSPVASPGSGWNNGGHSNFNYAVYFPQTSTFIGANVGGGMGYASTSMQYGSEFGSSMCCATCVKGGK